MAGRRPVTGRQKVLLEAGFVVLVGCALAWPAVDSYYDRPTVFVPSHRVKAVIEGNPAFALDLCQRMKDRPGNLIFSPCSISTGMAMVDAGARSNTADEIATTLRFRPSWNDLSSAFGELAARMDSRQHWRHVELIEANSLWCQKNHPFRGDYLSLIQTDFRGEAHGVDFRGDAPAVAQKLAAMIGEKTKGRLRPASVPLTEDTVLALCDTFYFSKADPHSAFNILFLSL